MGTNFKITSIIFLGVSLLACLTPDSLSAQCLLGDVNLDGIVDCADEQPFMAVLASGNYQCEADINGDGIVGLMDIPLFNNLLPPCPCLLGDVNQDGVVDCADEQPFMAVLASGGFQCEADINQDGTVDLMDVPLFNNLLPPCPPCLLGDVNQDGVVDCSDNQPFMAVLTSGGFQCEADINQDGTVDLMDIPLFNNLLPIPPCLRGDVDRSGDVNFFDVAPFLRALTPPTPPYQCEADMNQDGMVDFFDIAGFIKVLRQIPLPPCGC